PDRLAKALAAASCFGDDVIEPAGLFPQTELPDANPLRHVLACATYERQLEIVDDARAVGGDVGDEAALHEVDQDSRKAELDRMASHHQDDGALLAASGPHAVD